VPHPPRIVVLILTGLLVLAGCGSDDEPDAAASTPAATSEAAPTTEDGATSAPSETGDGGGEEAEAQTVAVSAVDFAFEIDSTELAAGETTIELTNDGGATHNLIVERDGEDVGGTDAIDPGATSSVTVDLEPGEYVFYCSIGNHRAMGMEVAVTVT
jgi:plastocyanin